MCSLHQHDEREAQVGWMAGPIPSAEMRGWLSRVYGDETEGGFHAG